MTVFTLGIALAATHSGNIPIATNGGVGIGESDVDLMGLVAFFLIAAGFLIAGCFLAHLRNSTFGETISYMYRGRTVANVGIVFIPICIPIVWVSFCAYQATNDMGSVLYSLIPIFSSGLAVELYADRVVGQAGASPVSGSRGESIPKAGVSGSGPPFSS